MSSITSTAIPKSAPSMCIPRTFRNITREHVIDTIKNLNIGLIDRVDMILRQNEKGEEFQRIFIHFREWFDNPTAIKARQMLLEGKEIKIIYDDPWFWKISANRAIVRSKIPDKPHKSNISPAPIIDFDDTITDRKYAIYKERKQFNQGHNSRGRQLEKVFVPRSPSSSPPPPKKEE